MPAITMEDDLGIVYLVDNAQQFWSELEDILTIPKHNIPTLEHLDLTLRRSLGLCAAYHQQYLQSPLQLDHACAMLLDSELFQFHSERMNDIVTSEAESNSNPHFQFIALHILLSFGRRKPDFFRTRLRWKPLLPPLMDNVLLELDVEETYFHEAIEAKLRGLSVRLLYEMCRVQKMSLQDLNAWPDSFLDHLFDLVEETRHIQDDTFNYSVIKLLVALNEQFMVASLDPGGNSSDENGKNRVLRLLIRRLGTGTSQTFAENMIFMLNRAQRTQEDLCMQLLVLKLLYLLFTTKGTEEYFYTNDLRVLVDVFLRELADLDEGGDGEQLRHTYLRVLHPLLTKTQLRSTPYKRPQIRNMLESLVRDSKVRQVNPTTKRLVERCLAGEWCVGLKKEKKDLKQEERDGSERSWTNNLGVSSTTSGPTYSASASVGPRALKSSRSMEFKKQPHRSASGDASYITHSPRSPIFDSVRRGSNASQMSTNSLHSLHGVAVASATPRTDRRERDHLPPPPINIVSPPSSSSYSPPPPSSTSISYEPSRPPRRSATADSTHSAHVDGTFADSHARKAERKDDREGLGETLDSTLVLSSISGMSLTTSSSPTRAQFGSISASGTSRSLRPRATSITSTSTSSTTNTRRSAPPPPTQTKRRKPPAPPVSVGLGVGGGPGVTFTTIKSSLESPLSR
ncbi:hypothetical protein BDP27DRAFT_1412355 [Rhodocollybia butyracea]|uniref:SPIN90/Ldb17 leucine-rich domain-containing protein n=1 Tax=Rhodocollybia butyracea TaxID=206335 RepID=A0A9P5QAQ3_9AGAR|nr:hypothetical protein BDP27DRAFT_1412355 [Rhodocollybia butyracea]